MLEANLEYGEVRPPVTPLLKSFMSTYMVGIRKRIADKSDLSYVYVKALSSDHAFEVADKIVREKDWIVKSVEGPGEELYGDTEGSTVNTPYFGGKYLNTLPEPISYV